MYVFTKGKDKKFGTIISIGMAILALDVKRCSKSQVNDHFTCIIYEKI